MEVSSNSDGTSTCIQSFRAYPVVMPVYFRTVPDGTLLRENADNYSMFLKSSRKKKGSRVVFCRQAEGG
ncbi:MAG: hypothetical protein D3903_21890 [Candidatus Electrothrix sp. GM3_4]|nr:hypothetical protein [Candidatus Electrothrix sp. GM3_4]